MVALHNINVKLRSYNSRLLNKATLSFIIAVRNVGGRAIGPIPLPRRTEVYVVNRSPHVHKRSMERFVRCTHTRFIRIVGVTPPLIDALSKIEILAGVGVDISITN